MSDEEYLTPEEEACLARVDAAVTVRALHQKHTQLRVTDEPRASVWKDFPLQQQAFEELERHTGRQDLRVYAQETSAAGKRRFIVTSPEELWTRLQSLSRDNRHMYEIIREGQPCHLYFDLEYDITLNPHLDGDSQVDRLVQEVVACMKAWLGVTVQPSRHVIELDSTSATKFSRHVIVQLKRAWRHNGHVNAFVTRFVQHLVDKRQAEEQALQPHTAEHQTSLDAHPAQSPRTGRPATLPAPTHGSKPQPQYRDFWVRTAPRRAPAPACSGAQEPSCAPADPTTAAAGPSGMPSHTDTCTGERSANVCEDSHVSYTLFLDRGVYTRNRAFRTYLSSKAGKQHTLRATRRYATAELLQQQQTQQAQQAQGHVSVKPSVHQPGVQRPIDKRLKTGPALGTHKAHGTSCKGSSLFDVLKQCETEQGNDDIAQGDTSHCPVTHTTEGPVRAPQPTRPVGAPDKANSVTTPTTSPTTTGTATTEAPHTGLLLTRAEEVCVAREVFFRSLATHTEACRGVKPLVMFPESEADAHTGLVPLGVPGVAGGARHRQRVGGHRQGVSATAVQPTNRQNGLRVHHGLTPFMELNEFVTRVCSEGGQPASVGTWTEPSPTNPHMLITIKGNRWCGFVNRPHKSNGIYVLLHLEQGTWCQKCFDDECRRYQAHTLPLPPELWTTLRHAYGLISEPNHGQALL